MKLLPSRPLYPFKDYSEGPITCLRSFLGQEFTLLSTGILHCLLQGDTDLQCSAQGVKRFRLVWSKLVVWESNSESVVKLE